MIYERIHHYTGGLDDVRIIAERDDAPEFPEDGKYANAFGRKWGKSA
jgi:hypothetical protein